MEGEKKPGVGAGLGKGLADFGKAIDDLAGEDDEEEEPKYRTEKEKKNSKDVLFGGREKKIAEGAEKDLDAMDDGDLAPMSEEPIPEPIIFKKEDFENSVWKVQVEKNGNWFSGNYAPDEFYVRNTPPPAQHGREASHLPPEAISDSLFLASMPACLPPPNAGHICAPLLSATVA